MDVDLLSLALGLALALLGGVGAVIVLARRPGARPAPPDGESARHLHGEISALRHQVEERNDQVVRQAVDAVIHVAGERLGTEHAKARAMLDERDRTFDQRAARMHEEFQRMRELVTELDQQRARGMGSLEQQLIAAQQATGELARTTGALREALASSRARGQWGERMAADVLRAAGFVEGINFVTQDTTDRGRPDFTFPLPAGRHLHMDVKFPLDNYLRHLEAQDDDARRRHAAAFVGDARRRIRELARKDYADTATGSVDQVLLFLPNEHVYAFLHQESPDLLDEALEQRVVLCSPVTLFAVLAVVRQAVEDHLTEQRSTEILEALRGFADQWDRFTGDLEKLGKRLGSAQRAFDDVNGVRRRQLERRLDRIDELHADEGSAAVLALAPSIAGVDEASEDVA